MPGLGRQVAGLERQVSALGSVGRQVLELGRQVCGGEKACHLAAGLQLRIRWTPHGSSRCAQCHNQQARRGRDGRSRCPALMVGAAVMTVALLFIVVAPIAMLLLQDPCVGRLFASRKVAHHCKGSWQVRAVSGQCLHTVRERHLPQHAQYRLIMSHSYALIS